MTAQLSIVGSFELRFFRLFFYTRSLVDKAIYVTQEVELKGYCESLTVTSQANLYPESSLAVSEEPRKLMDLMVV